MKHSSHPPLPNLPSGLPAPKYRTLSESRAATKRIKLLLMSLIGAGLTTIGVTGYNILTKTKADAALGDKNISDSAVKMPEFLRNYFHPETIDEEREIALVYEDIRESVHEKAKSEFQLIHGKLSQEMLLQFTHSYERILTAYEFVKKGYRTPEDFLGALQGGNNYFCDSHVDIVVKKHPQKPSTVPPRHLWIPDHLEHDDSSGHMVAFRQKNLDLK